MVIPNINSATNSGIWLSVIKRLKIKVIGEVLDYEGKTAEEFVRELEEKGINYFIVETKSGEVGDLSWKISEVKVYSGDMNKLEAEGGGNPIDYIGEEEIKKGVYFEIVVKEPEKETPSTSAASNRSSGSYSAPSSGYDNSGSYSAPSAEYDNSGNNGAFNGVDDFDGGRSAGGSTGEASNKSAKSKNESADKSTDRNFDDTIMDVFDY